MRINHYLLTVIKNNIIYLFSFIFILIIYAVFFNNLINQKYQLFTKIKDTQEEVQKLKIKYNLVNYKNEIQKEDINIDDINITLFQLIPDEEDYFSVVFALEKLSEETGFIITNYSVNLEKSTKNKLSLVVEGLGSQNSFFNFLKNYRYHGGRLLTIDKIEYQGQEYIKAKLNIYFYNSKIPSSLEFSSNYQLDDNQKRLIKKIKEEAKSLIKEEKEEDYSYPTKSDPF